MSTRHSRRLPLSFSSSATVLEFEGQPKAIELKEYKGEWWCNWGGLQSVTL